MEVHQVFNVFGWIIRILQIRLDFTIIVFMVIKVLVEKIMHDGYTIFVSCMMAVFSFTVVFIPYA